MVANFSISLFRTVCIFKLSSLLPSLADIINIPSGSISAETAIFGTHLFLGSISILNDPRKQLSLI
jgi:hypothetical protein